MTPSALPVELSASSSCETKVTPLRSHGGKGGKDRVLLQLSCCHPLSRRSLKTLRDSERGRWWVQAVVPSCGGCAQRPLSSTLLDQTPGEVSHSSSGGNTVVMPSPKVSGCCDGSVWELCGSFIHLVFIEFLPCVSHFLPLKNSTFFQPGEQNIVSSFKTSQLHSLFKQRS